MKQLLACVLIGFAITLTAQESTTFILVRHAEKADDGTRNPPLTEMGEKRANKLKELLEKAEISAIYSTPYKRTQMTVEPLAEAKKLEIQSYDWKSPEDFLSKLLADHAGGTVVISGHSNTTPFLANTLLGDEKFKQFDDSDYGNILVITASSLGSGQLLHLSF